MRKKKEDTKRTSNPNVMGLRAAVEEQNISDTLGLEELTLYRLVWLVTMNFCMFLGH